MQMTEQFIVQNPVLVGLCIGGLVLMLKFMATMLSKLVTQPYCNLTTAINSLTTEFKEYRKEAKADREKDQKEIGGLLDRMQAQETLCEVTRQFCPHGKGMDCGMNHKVNKQEN
jgi:hypothetical protein